MKKQKILLMLITVVIISCLFLTSCTLVKVNKERQANEILATVSLDYNGNTMSLVVTRNELLSYVNYLINLYSQYQMQYDVKALISDGLDGLINQKYLVLQGMVYLLEVEGRQQSMYLNTAEYKNLYGDNIVPEGVLTMAERYATIEDANKSFYNTIEQYVTSYENEQREILLSTAKEKLTSYYNNGYSVDSVDIFHYDAETEEYAEGLYKTSFIFSASQEEEAETDYKEVYLKISLKKGSSDNVVVYYPVTSAAITTAEKDVESMTFDQLKEYKTSQAYLNNHLQLKTVTVKYDEPVKATEEGQEDSYNTHTAQADFLLVTPRTAYKEAEEEDTRSDSVIANEGDIKFRYTILDANNDEHKQIIADGKIFEHTPLTYASDAEKDAYRQFREAKKSQLIGFSAENNDAYNNLGYYYKSSFESAILDAVKHELSKKALNDSPITNLQIQREYDNLVAKQKEEYQNLTQKQQVEKFAEIIATDLTNCYYIPIDALTKQEFEYNDATYTYATENNGKVSINMFYIAHVLFKWTVDLSDQFAILIEDRTDEEVKEIKTRFVDYLKTNKSNIDYATEGAENAASDLEAAFEMENQTDLKSYLVTAVVEQLKTDLLASDNPLETFQEYMSMFNDDSGSMSSKLGYFVATGDISHSYDGDDFPNMAKDLYFKLIASDTNPNNAKEVAEFAFTSYGMHINYISFAPFYNIELVGDNTLGIDFALDLDNNTFGETIKATLEEKVTANAYTEWTGKFDSDDIKANHSQRDEKKVKRLLKDLNLN